ncbi:alpha/beta fold hydrolase [Candidatus Gracilibacteria bacterium]|nr:alpha/beta fold hydrolase [Candidatus Gracilibacteria bacterium]
MPLQRVSFTGATGEQLAARLDLPEATPRAYALFAHCFTCGKNLKAASAISRALNAAGIAVLRFDFTGLGESEGDFADTTFATNVADLVAASAYLAAEHMPPALLIGHSLGGAAVLQAASAVPSARAIVTIAAPAEPSHVLKLLEASRPEIEARGCVLVHIGERSVPITREFLAELAETKMATAIGGLKRPLLICHAPLDDTVGIDNAAQIYQQARHPKSFLALDAADHLLSRREDAEYAGSVIAAWAARYLPHAEAVPVPETIVGVELHIGASSYTTTVRAGRHQLLADEPLSAGGADLGLNPYDFLLAALGACTAMTLRMYADRKGWPLQGTTVRLSHAKIHASDCAECETKEGRIDRIERIITLEGPLDAEQRARLREIADRCPVHRTLHGEIEVRTRVEEVRSQESGVRRLKSGVRNQEAAHPSRHSEFGLLTSTPYSSGPQRSR